MTMSAFNKGPAYGLSAEVKNKIAQKYDPQKEEELRIWIEEITGASIGPDFQKGLKNGVILCELINKLQPGSVKKINQSALNWHQLENLTNFIKAITAYGLKPHDIFEANDLFENGNMTQVQTTLLALASMVRLTQPPSTSTASVWRGSTPSGFLVSSSLLICLGQITSKRLSSDDTS
uniref:Calponin 3 n=1 Tax=Amphilophus citrinellus TaxID=61819 RepID=A0A3Q0T2T4_AMPCI